MVGGPGGDALLAQGVTRIYRAGTVEVRALDGVDLRIGEGELVAVIGASGSGKTTLLNCCSGLDEVDEGSVFVAGRDLHAMSDDDRAKQRARTMGFVFQSFNLLPMLDAVENVELPLLLAGTRARRARAAATAMLERVGLGDRTRHRPLELSGGEQQRVAIARALVNHPHLLWADEPTGALDTENAVEVMKLLLALHRAGQTIVLVTHDVRISRLADRIVRMRDGRIVSDDPVAHPPRVVAAAG